MYLFDSIICISQTPWQGNFQKPAVQLMTELAPRHSILYVDYQYTFKDSLFGLAGRQSVPVGKMLRLSDPLVQKTVGNGSRIHTWIPPAALPVNWLPNRLHDLFSQQNAQQLIDGLLKTMNRLGMKKPLIINAFNPVLGLPLIGKLNECATIYYCFDEITAESWMRRHGARYEEEYLEKITAIVTTSETLRTAKAVRQPKAFCVKNGANFDLFNTARALAVAQPPTEKIVGYLGTADNRIDIDLVEFCVRTMPDVTFEFIGEVNEALLRERLTAYPNIVFTPPHQPDQLPPLLARLSGAIIPFLCNEHTYTIYPLKINEYLAAGLPVVSTQFSTLDDFKDIVKFAGSPEQFAIALRDALDDNQPQRIQERVDVAHGNSWTKRAEEFEAVIRQLPTAWAA